jgi:hypothetical protein
MKRFKLLFAVLVVFCATTAMIFTFNMVGNSTPTALAAPAEIYDICHITNTDIITEITDWAGFRDCVYTYENAN